MKTKDITAECQKDADKLYGVPPYNTGSNIVLNDGYFSRACERDHGEVAWAKACKEANRKLKMVDEAAKAVLAGDREKPSERIRRLTNLLKEAVKIVQARTSRSLSTNQDWLERARKELK